MTLLYSYSLNSICECHGGSVGKDDGTGSQQEAISRSLQVNVNGSIPGTAMCTHQQRSSRRSDGGK